jgi:hypothetical protein
MPSSTASRDHDIPADDASYVVRTMESEYSIANNWLSTAALYVYVCLLCVCVMCVCVVYVLCVCVCVYVYALNVNNHRIRVQHCKQLA